MTTQSCHGLKSLRFLVFGQEKGSKRNLSVLILDNISEAQGKEKLNSTDPVWSRWCMKTTSLHGRLFIAAASSSSLEGQDWLVSTKNIVCLIFVIFYAVLPSYILNLFFFHKKKYKWSAKLEKRIHCFKKSTYSGAPDINQLFIRVQANIQTWREPPIRTLPSHTGHIWKISVQLTLSVIVPVTSWKLFFIPNCETRKHL